MWELLVFLVQAGLEIMFVRTPGRRSITAARLVPHAEQQGSGGGTQARLERGDPAAWSSWRDLRCRDERPTERPTGDEGERESKRGKKLSLEQTRREEQGRDGLKGLGRVQKVPHSERDEKVLKRFLAATLTSSRVRY